MLFHLNSLSRDLLPRQQLERSRLHKASNQSPRPKTLDRGPLRQLAPQPANPFILPLQLQWQFRLQSLSLGQSSVPYQGAPLAAHRQLRLPRHKAKHWPKLSKNSGLLSPEVQLGVQHQHHLLPPQYQQRNSRNLVRQSPVALPAAQHLHPHLPQRSKHHVPRPQATPINAQSRNLSQQLQLSLQPQFGFRPRLQPQPRYQNNLQLQRQRQRQRQLVLRRQNSRYLRRRRSSFSGGRCRVVRPGRRKSWRPLLLSYRRRRRLQGRSWQLGSITVLLMDLLMGRRVVIVDRMGALMDVVELEWERGFGLLY